ncbi:MBL fold metallo-hydrolase [Lentibacillus saliphilus]|uniref:MBL fold metallo-hydrolase n=1 Tax=Lentibacillus saliphilus TaxID=2737028 RepID=UPI001C30A486|nr:MBL fold metallo-hydrolase [Lentibacillus saliphilus]
MIKDKVIHQITLPTPFAVGDVHVYILKGEALTLIDAGVNTDEAWNALKTGLRQIGYHPRDIEQIILTHHHPDHTGLVGACSRVQSIAAHETVNLWLTRDEVFFRHYERFFYELFEQCAIPETYHHVLKALRAPLKFAGEGQVTTVLQEGDALPGHPEWNVIETKGHAQSHLSFWRESDKTLIGGDHLLYHISPNPLIEPGRHEGDRRPKPMLQYRESLNKCFHLGIEKVLPGHGPCFSDVNSLIRQRLKKQEERADKVWRLLHERPQSPFDLCRAIFPHQYENQLNLTMSETIGQLDYLEAKGLATSFKEDDRLVYKPIVK